VISAPSDLESTAAWRGASRDSTRRLDHVRTASDRNPTRRTGLAARIGVVVLAVFALTSFGSGTVHAENTVVTSSPAAGDVRGTSPTEIVITFSEEIGDTNLLALSCEAEQIALDTPEVGDDRLLLTAALPAPVPAGTCVIRWQVTNTDDEPNGEGTIPFSVQNDTVVTTVPADDAAGDAAAPTPTAIPATTDSGTGSDAGTETAAPTVVVDLSIASQGDGPLWLGRLISTLAIAALFGALVLLAASWPEGVEYLITIKFIRVLWVVALLGTLLFVAAASAAATGRGLGSGFSPTAWIDLLEAGWAGRAAVLRLVFVAMAAWVAFRPDRAIDPTTQIGGLGIPALAVAMTGITRTIGDLAAVGVLISIIHALAVAVWLGGVVLLARVVLSGPGEEDLVHAVRGFGRISTIAIVVTVVTGIAQLVRLDGGALFDSGHGRVLLFKSVVVAVMIFLAISARQFVAQRLARAQEMSAPLADRLRRAFGAEAGIGVVTFALSAWLLALSPPNIDTTPTIPYDVSTTFQVPEADFDVRLRITDDVVGLVGIEVDVRSPSEGLSALNIVFTAPPNDQNIGSITQPIPLTGPGRAVRLESEGIPLTVPGVWQVQVTAIVNGAQVVDTKELNVLNADGTPAATEVTFPPATIVTVPSVTIVTIPPDN
jgi:copper transport protein